MSKDPVTIVGGGIAGLAAALAASNAGRQVLVLERAAQFEEVGAGLQLGPNAVHALERLGVWDAVAPITTAPRAIVIHDARRGTVLKRIVLTGRFEAAFGAPYRVAHRADLHGVLLSALRSRSNIAVRTGAAVQAVHIEGAIATLHLDPREELQSRLVIAADGVNSGLRQAHFANTGAVSAGHVIHRALLADWSLDIAEPEAVHLWMGPGFHVVHYPVGQKQKLNVVCVTHEGSTPEDILRHCAVPLAAVLRSSPQWLPWPALYVPPLAGWQKGKLILIGDAAHGTVPYQAQGAAMALEDAAHLQTQLMRSASGEIVALDFAARQQRTRTLHEMSLANGRIYHLAGLAAEARNLALRLMPESIFLGRLSEIYMWRNE